VQRSKAAEKLGKRFQGRRPRKRRENAKKFKDGIIRVRKLGKPSLEKSGRVFGSRKRSGQISTDSKEKGVGDQNGIALSG